MLDNFTVEQILEAVKRIDRRLLTEISGGVTIDNISCYAAAGVDLISSGAITHSANALDVGLDFTNEKLGSSS